MDKRFIVNRQGRDFVLYSGLIDQAHQEGLKRITTKLLQAPTAENGYLAIVWAEVETAKGVFSGIGDASPDNVGRMIAPHIVRMSETRAKARALRDAINVGMSAVEELGEDEESPEASPRQLHQRAPQQQRQVTQQQQRGGAAGSPRPDGVRSEGFPAAAADDLPASCQPASSAQLTSLAKLRVALGRPSVVPDGLTSEQAAAQIRELVQVFNESQKSTRR